MIKCCSSHVHLSQRTQILATTTEAIILTERYKDLENGFSTENSGLLPLYEDHDNAIYFVDGKQPVYLAYLQFIRK